MPTSQYLTLNPTCDLCIKIYFLMYNHSTTQFDFNDPKKDRIYWTSCRVTLQWLLISFSRDISTKQQNVCRVVPNISSGSSGWVGGAEKHEIHAEAFWGHLFYNLSLQGRVNTGLQLWHLMHDLNWMLAQTCESSGLTDNGCCAVPFAYVSLQVLADEQRAVRSRPLETSGVCIWRLEQVNSTEISHLWKMLFKRRVWISRGYNLGRDSLIPQIPHFFRSVVGLVRYHSFNSIKIIAMKWARAHTNILEICRCLR